MIYFVRTGDYVKIGWSRSKGTLRRRLDALRIASPYPTELVHTLEGGEAAEAWLHETFSEFLVRGEWFLFSADMLSVRVPPHLVEPTVEDDPIVQIRVPEPLMAKVRLMAASDRRTPTAQILFLLEEALRQRESVNHQET